jgi:hypothetical protein
MNFLRHVGKIGDRKVALVFREVPNEPHMCLVTYTETLNQHIHEAVINCIESQIGQSSENLADALNRTHTKDGKYVLQLLHKENLLKKVQTSQVIMTPNPKTSIKLDELNKILNEMQQGEQAVKRLAEINTGADESTMEVVKQMRTEQTALQTAPIVAASNDVLGDSILANNLKQQAAKMEIEAKGLLVESQRLQQQAAELLGVSTTSQNTTEPTAKKRGRPAKASITA